MSRLLISTLGLCATVSLGLQAQAIANEALSAALVQALGKALPFPALTSEGTPVGGSAEPAWAVRWPAAGDLRIEVLANPLNTGNRDRALKAEREIQKSAMNAQLRSQGDYERAVREFETTGRVSSIREISLRDDGLAGERYDAESQLTIDVESVQPGHQITIATSVAPVASNTVAGGAVVRVAANAFEQVEPGDLPAIAHYCPEQAWVVLGPVGQPVIRRREGAQTEVSFPGRAEAPGGHLLIVAISGNAALVEQVIRQTDWAVLRALTEG